MPPKLTTHNAEIRTATVEIKTLTVSGKQVTLAVFRQLPQGRLINPDGSLNGEAWGTVNYHPEPKACPTADHWHTVWQSGTELRRSTDEKQPVLGTYWPAVASAFLTSVVLDHITGGTTYFDNGRSLPLSSLPGVSEAHVIEGVMQTGHEGLLVGMEATRAAVLAYRSVRRAEEMPDNPYTLENRDKAIGDLRAEVAGFAHTTDELFVRYQAICDKEAARRDRIREAHQQLGDLPQLFIAV